MIKDTPEAVIKWADALHNMESMLQATEGPTVCSWWIMHMIKSVITYRRSALHEPKFGYHLARNLIASLEPIANLKVSGWDDGPLVFPGLDVAINTIEDNEDGQ